MVFSYLWPDYDNMHKTKIKLLYLLTLTLLLASCAKDNRVKTLKLGHSNDASHPVHIAMTYMGERLEALSGGAMRMDVYPSSILGNERECIELLQIGSLAMTKASASNLEGFAPAFRVVGLPYIFRDREHQFKALDSDIGEDLRLKTQKFWLRGLAFYDAGSRSFYTIDKPVRTPDDLKGLKIRVMTSNTAMNMVKAFGGSPTPIAFAELYTALQQGVVDGAENNAPSIFFQKHHEVCKFYTINEHTAVPDVLLMSTVVWNSLSDQEKEWVQQAADESAIFQREVWAKSEKETLDGIKAAGVEIIYPDKAPFAEKVEFILEEYKDNEEAWDLIQRIKAVK